MNRLIYSLILLACCLCSCTKEKPVLLPAAQDQETSITFEAELPAMAEGIRTYALDDAAENTLQTVDGLVFQVNADGTETFAYRVQGTTITSNSLTEKRFVMKFQRSAGIRVVLLGNVRSQLNAISLTAGELKSALVSRLIYTKTGKWNANSVTSYDPLPYYGETSVLDLSGTATNVPVLMMRSLSRLDVKLSTAAAAVFKISSVSLVNSKTSGMIVPLAENYTSLSGPVTAPSLPSGLAANDILTYTLSSPGDSLVREIYTFETAAAAAAGASGATALVVGGSYNGGATSYYRVDLLNGSGTPVPLLRNFKYTFTVASVSGNGYADVQTAFNSRSFNMTVNLNLWNEAEISNVVTDGLYTLGTSKEIMVLWREAYTVGNNHKVNIATDYQSGWTATTTASWLSLSAGSGAAGTPATVTMGLKNKNTTGAIRTAEVVITAGRLTKTLQVLDLPFYIQFHDQVRGKSWYEYNNVPDNWNTAAAPSTNQVSPARAGSCAALGTGWRVPTQTELQVIYDLRKYIGGFVYEDQYATNYVISEFYWSSSASTDGDLAKNNGIHFNTGSQSGNQGNQKTNQNYNCRCVCTPAN